jgi:outer membrane lipoprotein-sorting protein
MIASKVKWIRTILVLLFLFVLTFEAFSLDNNFILFKTFTAEFQRETIENNELLSTKGSIFFYLPYNVLIDVNEPLNQIMKIDSNLMLIYYPEENKATKIKSNEPLTLPIISPFFSATKNDFGLSLIGYSIKDYNMISDTLITKWINPNIDDEKSLYFIIKSFNNSISEVAVYKSNSNKIIKRMIFNSYVSYVTINNEISFPQELVIYDNEDSEQIVETITLKNIKIDIQLPDSVINFKIPSNAEVEEVQW